MARIEKWFQKIETLSLWLSYTALTVMMILTSFDAISRYVFKQSITGAYEVTEMYLMVILVFLSLSYVQKVDGHIRLDILFERLPQRFRDYFNIFFYALGSVFFFFIGYQGLLMTMNAWKNNLIASGLIDLPLWLSYIWIPIGSFLITVRLLLLIIKLAMGEQEDSKMEDEVDIL